MAKSDVNRLKDMKITDMEIIEYFNLDPSLAGTKALHDAAADVVYRNNIKEGMAAGDSEGKAKAMAGRMRADTKSTISKEMKK